MVYIMTKTYEFEMMRTGVSAKSFWNLANKKYEEKTGMTLEAWIDSFEDWKKPFQEFDINAKHEDWDEPLREVSHCHPFTYQVYLQNGYNFILEWDDGFGYIYVIEYNR